MAKSTDISVRQVGPKSAKRSIRKAIQTRRPVFLWGPPGIGKSDIVKQIGEDAGREVVDVRLALWEPTDIKGIPYYNADQGKMVWAPPSELPTDPESTAVIFLDELNSAPPAVQAAAYQLILNRRVGTYELPKGVDVVAAGNREGDRGVTYRMPAPLANRFIHLEMRVDFDDWFEWATTNRIHKDVAGFLQFSKKDLYDFDPKSNSRSFATPRSWTFISELLSEDDGDENTLADLISGGVGEGLAIKFMAHRKVAGKLPNPSDILKGKVKKMETKEISAMYSLTVSLCYELKDAADKNAKDWNNQVNCFFEFMMNNFETELVVMGTKLALTQYQLPLDPDEITCFDAFHAKYGKYISQATERR